MNARSVPSEINSSRRIASLGGDTRPQYDTGICNKCRITFRGAKVARRVTCLLLSLVSDIRTHRVQSSKNKFIVLRRLSRLVFHIFSFFSFPSRFFFFFSPSLSFRLRLSTAIRQDSRVACIERSLLSLGAFKERKRDGQWRIEERPWRGEERGISFRD